MKNHINYLFKYYVNIIYNTMLINIRMARYGRSRKCNKNCITTDPGSKITLGVSIVFILLSIRCIFFDPTSKEEIKDKQGVLLENSNGKLMISKRNNRKFS